MEPFKNNKLKLELCGFLGEESEILWPISNDVKRSTENEMSLFHVLVY